MDDETRDRISDELRKRNQRRGNCRRCGSPSVRRMDGKDAGPDCFAGILYDVCGGCGFTNPKPKARKPRRG